jgi:hypothetical protein
MSIKAPKTALLGLCILAFAVVTARAELFSVSASGTISANTSSDTTIPVGTPWVFELIYDTDAPDRDFVLTTTPDPTFGGFDNDGDIPALRFFHYRAGTYEVTLDDPDDFGPFSNFHVTFINGVHAIDLNLNADSLFPPLGGGPVRFHADFNAFGPNADVFTSDALPTDTTITAEDFQESSVSLFLPNSKLITSSQPEITSLTIAAVPEPSACAFAIIGVAALLNRRSRSGTRRADVSWEDCGSAH